MPPSLTYLAPSVETTGQFVRCKRFEACSGWFSRRDLTLRATNSSGVRGELHHVNPSDHDDGAPSFRERLSRIPDVEADPPEQYDWQTAAPPVVQAPERSRRQAPVARPSPGPRVEPQRARQPQEPVYDEPEFDDYEPLVVPRRRRRWPLVLFFLLALLGLALIIPLYIARQTFNDIERIPVAQVLQEPIPEGRNILLVGTDSRDGIDADTENAGLILGEGDIAGERTDTIMVLRIEEGGSKFLSLPRDLWLPINGGAEQRINTAYVQGPIALINTVQSELGIPLSHFVEVDLAGFIDVVDAVGGVDVTIEHPAFDRASGLNLPTAGTVTLDSTQALAWVRSRRYTEVINGAEVVDGTSDIGRVARQQEFMRALMAKVAEQRNPVVLNDMASSMSTAVAMDDATSLTDALEIANTMRTATPVSVVLPTVPTTRGSNSVLVLGDGAAEVLREFGAPGAP